MKNFQEGESPVISEFYSGMLGYWQNSRPKVNSADVVMLSLNASFNIYLFHGVTSFGFTSGGDILNSSDANIGNLPQLTSYDFDAPLTEAGDLTEKYFKIKQTLENAESL